MRIASVTISDSRAAEIEDALRSVVDHVDVCILIDTGITDDTAERALAVVGKKLRVAEHKWIDFATARNFALRIAAESHVDWVVMLDTDERFLGPLRKEISAATGDVLLVQAHDGYAKEKIFRLPTKMQYVGPTHESPVGPGVQETLRETRFNELFKSAEQLQKKFARDVELLTTYTAEHPGDPRWWYYLGDALDGLGRLDEAVGAFDRCAAIRDGWNEQAAWACYRAAEICLKQDRFVACIDHCASGLARHAGTGELAWMASVAAFRAGLTDQASWWARISEALGNYRGIGPLTGRFGFKNLEALWELPFDVLRYSERQLGRPESAARAEEDFHAAKKARQGFVVDAGDPERLALSRFAGYNDRQGARESLVGKLLGEYVGGVRTDKLSLPADVLGRFTLCNPSVCSFGDELLINLRAVNYRIGPDGAYITPDEDKTSAGDVIKTRNFLARLDGGAAVSDVVELVDRAGGERRPWLVEGYEDVRLYASGGRLRACATVRDRDPSHDCRVAVLDIDQRAGAVESALVVTRFSSRHEKNWMPIAARPDSFLYTVDPLRIVHAFDPAKDRSGDVFDLALDHVRGGSQVIAVRGGQLCCVHETQHKGLRIYLHRFVLFDAELKRVLGVSRVFSFTGARIEFCAGMALVGDELVLSVGVMDAEAIVVRLPAAAIDELLIRS